MSINALDLFCGAGGSSWGASAAGASVVCGIDGWELATRTYADNFPKAKAVTAWLRPTSNRRLLGGIPRIDLLLASPECTNHTCARGSRARDEESRRTARFVLNYATGLKPRWIVIENVIQMRNWSGYSQLLKLLHRDYRVTEQVLDAVDFGVPQTRRRLFVICDREVEPPNLSPTRRVKPRAARSILDPTGIWKARPLFGMQRARPTIQRARRAIRELGEGVPFLIVYYGSDGAGGWQSLDRPLRTLTTLDRFGLVEWSSGEPTLRMLQVPELKRAMGFDPSFRFCHGSRRDRIKLLGNAVSPPVMAAIVGELIPGAVSYPTLAAAE